MTLNRSLLIMLLSLALLAVACGADDSGSVSTGGSSVDDGTTSPGGSAPADTEAPDDGQPVVSNSLIGTRWTISHIEPSGGSKQTQPQIEFADPATIEFADHRISGNAGCNSYQVSWEPGPERLSLSGDLSITEIACIDSPDWFGFTDMLTRMTHWSIAGDTLLLTNDSGESIVATSNADDEDSQTDTQPGLVDTNLLKQLVGLTETAAGEMADAAGRPWRVVARDGEHFPVTADYSEDRLNFTIVDDIVTEVEIG